jgi:hypothetical protein
LRQLADELKIEGTSLIEAAADAGMLVLNADSELKPEVV